MPAAVALASVVPEGKLMAMDVAMVPVDSRDRCDCAPPDGTTLCTATLMGAMALVFMAFHVWTIWDIRLVLKSVLSFMMTMHFALSTTNVMLVETKRVCAGRSSVVA